MITISELNKRLVAFERLKYDVLNYQKMKKITEISMYFQGHQTMRCPEYLLPTLRDAAVKSAADAVCIVATELRSMNVDPTSEIPEELR